MRVLLAGCLQDWVLPVTLLLLLWHPGSALNVAAPQAHSTLIGSTTLLPCTFTVGSPPINPQLLAILWYHGEKELIRYNSKEKFAQPGMSIDGREAQRGNASLTIHNATIPNQGTYRCLVVYHPNREAKDIQFSVQAPPLVSLVKKAFLKNKNNRLLCMISNFYPMDIKVTWLLNGEQRDGAEFGPFQSDADGKYNVSSSITIPPLQSPDPPSIACQVEHPALQDPIQDAFTGQYVDECQCSCHHGITAIFFILFILVLIFMIYYLFIWRKGFHVSHIYMDQRWTEDKVIFYCMASECRGEAEVIWTVIEDGKEPIEISDPPKNKDEEMGLLLQTAELSLKNHRSQEGGRHNVTSILTYKLEGSQPRNLEVRCKFLYSGKSTEKFLKSTFYKCKKPEISKTDPIEVSLDDSGCVVCSLTLERFFPKTIDIKWSHEDRQISTRVDNNDSHTYNAVSECRVPAHLFQDPHFRVRAEWSHKSMDKPESREISVKDLPWLPVIDDIIVPPLIHGRESSFRCVIRRYFLDNLEVKWFRREAGKPELYEVNSGDKYKFPVKEVTREPDQTFTTVSTLIASLTVEDEGSEFICRVTQPCLEKPPQKATGGLNVTGKPTVRRALQDRSQIILKVGGFYMPDLRVIWERADKEYGSYKRIEEKYIQNIMEVCEDGSRTLTSICEAVVMGDHLNPNDLYYKAILHHGSLKSPEETIFLRRKKIFYLITKSGPKPLEQTN